MKEIISFAFIFLISIIFLPSCSKSPYDKKEVQIDFRSISIVKRNGKEFLEIGRLKRVVKLEVTGNSLIGEIDKVLVDSKIGDIYILDRFISKKLFRFDKKGKFINTYGKQGQGPGEYTDINNFTIDSNGHVIFLTPFKLLKFEKDGQFLKEKPIKFNSFDITSLLDRIYVFVLNYKSNTDYISKKSILILDNDFNELGGLYPFDIRFEKYRFLCSRNLSENKNSLFFIDNYDLALKIYNHEQDKISRLEIPNDNNKLDVIWGKTHFLESDRTEIKNRIHRFDSIFALYDILFLTERCKEKKIFNYWLLNLEKRKAIIFNFPWNEFAAGKLFFLPIQGSYNRELIGILSDESAFNSYKITFENEYPILKEIEFSIEDNPVLVFIEFEDKIWE